MIQIASDMKLDLNRDLAPDYSLDMNKTNEYLKSVEEDIKKIKTVQNDLIQVNKGK